MTERQALIAHKQTVLRAKARLKQMRGIETVRLYEENAPKALDRLYSAYCAAVYSGSQEPYSRLPCGSPPPEVYAWLIAAMGLREGNEYFFRCGLWARIRIRDLLPAVESLWGDYNNFLLAETDFTRVMEAGFDSRNEDHYLIDIWKPS